MAKVIIIGDGPAGLSAALFLAKNGMDVTVFGEDGTDMHRALLFNYLGRPKIPGKEFQTIAAEQVKSFGADIRRQKVTAVIPKNDNFEVVTEDGQLHVSSYVILADGKLFKLAQSLNLPHTADGVEVDRDGRTTIDRLYAIGRGTRKSRSAAIISAGAGAVTALDILSREAGKMINDFDVMPAA